jgi:hypothetical protein
MFLTMLGKGVGGLMCCRWLPNPGIMYQTKRMMYKRGYHKCSLVRLLPIA